MLFLVISVLILLIRTRRSRVPYFPIEISRCAEADPVVLQVSSVMLGVIMLIFRESSFSGFLLWIAMLLISFFDDKKYWEIHMFGIAILGVYFLLTCTFWQVVLMSTIYFSRLAIKAYALIVYEHCPMDLMAMKENALEIMYTGRVYNENTKRLFKICGVLQWVCFAIKMVI